MKNYIKIILLLFSFIQFSCNHDDETSIDNSISNIKISTGEIYPNFSPEIKDYYITSLNSLNNINVTIENYDGNKNIFINNQKVTNKITALKLDINQDIIVESYNHNGEKLHYTIHYLPIDLPKANVITKNNPSDGLILVNLFELSATSPKNFSYIAILNNDGFPVYYKKLPYAAVINFKYFDIGQNQKRFSYNVDEIGKVVVMNENFDEIYQYDLLPNNGHLHIRSDNHDYIHISDNHYIIPAYVVRENVDMTAYGGANSVDLIDFVFQEVVNNEVVFEWNSANYPELLAETDDIYYNQYATSPKVDYFHFNAINIDPNDNNFIVSARHTNTVYKINRTTGSIMWRFGGKNDDFNLTGNTVISHQHHATILNNGNLLLFDNGVTKSPQQSRLVEFSINENNFTATIAHEYSESGKFLNIMGSAQKLTNGNYFIGWGGHITSQVNANKSDITEVNASGNILLNISFSNNSNYFSYSYRALKYNISF